MAAAPPEPLLDPKPSRSEDLLDPQEQLRIAEAVRQKFAEEAPKRHRKPSRSDLLENPLQEEEVEVIPGSEIPEYVKFQGLQASTERLVGDYTGDAPEEFVETEYYKDLNAVDKTMHHTTGTGFIRMECNGVVNLNLSPNGLVRTKSQCNPATNDWIPSPDTVYSTSDKPHRSDP